MYLIFILPLYFQYTKPHVTTKSCALLPIVDSLAVDCFSNSGSSHILSHIRILHPSDTQPYQHNIGPAEYIYTQESDTSSSNMMSGENGGDPEPSPPPPAHLVIQKSEIRHSFLPYVKKVIF